MMDENGMDVPKTSLPCFHMTSLIEKWHVHWQCCRIRRVLAIVFHSRNNKSSEFYQERELTLSSLIGVTYTVSFCSNEQLKMLNLPHISSQGHRSR
jgi:hypothetical protein